MLIITITAVNLKGTWTNYIGRFSTERRAHLPMHHQQPITTRHDRGIWSEHDGDLPYTDPNDVDAGQGMIAGATCQFATEQGEHIFNTERLASARY